MRSLGCERETERTLCGRETVKETCSGATLMISDLHMYYEL